MLPGQNDLVTLSQAYAWLGLTPGSDDNNLQLAVSGVSQLIASWCSRNFVEATYTEDYDGVDTSRLTLRNWPIISIASLTIDGIAIPVATSPTGTGFRADARRTIGLCGYCFCRGFQNIVVTYTAGYASIPADLVMACLQWVSATYLASGRDPAIVMQRAGGTAQQFEPGGAVTNLPGNVAPMPASVYAVLSQYRDQVPV